MKKLLIVMLLVSNSSFGMGVWNRVKQWFTQTPQERLECPEFRDFPQVPVEPFSFQELPLEIQTSIILATTNASNLEKATDTIRALSQTNKELNQILNNERYNKGIAKELAKKFSVSPLTAQIYLGTKIDKEFFQKMIATDAHGLFKAYQEAQYLNVVHNSKRSNAIARLLFNAVEKFRNDYQFNEKQFRFSRIIWAYSDQSVLTEDFDGANVLLLALFDKDKNLIPSFGGINNFVDQTGLFNTEKENTLTGVSQIFNLYYDGKIYSAVQPDNKLIVAGVAVWNGEYILLRFNTDGSIDTTFGNNGIVKTAITYNPGDDIRHIDNLKSKNKQKEIDEFLDLKKFGSYLTINPQNGDVIFKFKDAVKKYTADGKEIN